MGIFQFQFYMCPTLKHHHSIYTEWSGMEWLCTHSIPISSKQKKKKNSKSNIRNASAPGITVGMMILMYVINIIITKQHKNNMLNGVVEHAENMFTICYENVYNVFCIYRKFCLFAVFFCLLLGIVSGSFHLKMEICNEIHDTSTLCTYKL
jgi:hypothetical protein